MIFCLVIKHVLCDRESSRAFTHQKIQLRCTAVKHDYKIAVGKGYKHGKTARPHSFCILIAGMLFSLNCNSACRIEVHPSAECLFFFFCVSTGQRMLCGTRDLPPLSDTCPLPTPASGHIKLASRRHSYVIPVV